MRIRLGIAYDGSPFAGWATQPTAPTVQGALEAGLTLLLRRPARLTVAGRTDAGVHARGQVAHLDVTPAEWDGLGRRHGGDPADALLRRLRGVLGRVLSDIGPHAAGAIVVHSAATAPSGFDARFSALSRRYSYRIADPAAGRDPLVRGSTLWHPEPLDVDALNGSASAVTGVADFLPFCKPRDHATTVRDLQRFRFVRQPDGVVVADVVADAFCHHMVRGLIGAALHVGDGRRDTGWLRERLDARIRDSAIRLAPPHPLVLEEVTYPAAEELAARATATRARRDPLD
ncbi:tRNA pseudouridine(38-40) synthase TruA [Tersicoccus phoenicis]|uniref:tRNA pseudouridine synthase A n=1 Tax=Tersicoccus phoenicis TaxID=554083 RepID=A0A1R1L6S7_9MICC|nr:tRNA pseudouridine(38-40) synthase TruA [Tersicoccus phoenicis]